MSYDRHNEIAAPRLSAECYDAITRSSCASELMGQESDVVPLPRQVRKLAIKLLRERYQKRAQTRRGTSSS
ncbi:MAG TPA: hypothetical protein VHJ20_05190 [Polyangia bacterium]|nr:hypothetical protein [Polyangia bacterium]